MKKGFNNICEKILGREEAAVDAYLQLEAFRRKEGTFSNPRAFETVKKMPAYQWWSANIDEEEAPELKQVAERGFCLLQHASDDMENMYMRGALFAFRV